LSGASRPLFLRRLGTTASGSIGCWKPRGSNAISLIRPRLQSRADTLAVWLGRSRPDGRSLLPLHAQRLMLLYLDIVAAECAPIHPLTVVLLTAIEVPTLPTKCARLLSAERLKMLKTTKSVILGLGLMLGFSAFANAAPARPAMAVSQASQKHFANASGRSLYTFDKDTPGNSECNLLCAAAWPPLLAPAGARASGHWSLVQRASGLMQWAYNGSPLYTYRFDFKPGDVRGDGSEGVWHLARP